jgi:hypothetical protein
MSTHVLWLRSSNVRHDCSRRFKFQRTAAAKKKSKKSVAVSYLGTSRRALRSIQRMIKCSVSREIASRRVEFDLKTERKKQLNHKKKRTLENDKNK